MGLRMLDIRHVTFHQPFVLDGVDEHQPVEQRGDVLTAIFLASTRARNNSNPLRFLASWS